MSALPVTFNQHPKNLLHTQDHRGFRVTVTAAQADPAADWSCSITLSVVDALEVDDNDENARFTTSNNFGFQLPLNEVQGRIGSQDFDGGTITTQEESVADTIRRVLNPIVEFVIPTPAAP